MGDVNGKQAADTVLQYSWGSSLIRDSQRCLSTSSAAWFGSGADYYYKSAGAVRQTDRETHREAAELARQSVSSVRAENCFAVRSPRLSPS